MLYTLFFAITLFAFAEEEFNVEALQCSRFDKRGDYWSIAGEFSGFADGYTVTVTAGAYLSSTYVSEGWRPELRITCKNNINNQFYEVTAFRATVNGKAFSFDNLAYNANPYIHAGYLFGGKEYREFIETMKDIQSASFWFDYKDADGMPGWQCRNRSCAYRRTRGTGQCSKISIMIMQTLFLLI